MTEKRRYTTMFGEEFWVPWAGDIIKTHKVAKHIAKAMMNPAQRTKYQAGGGLYVIDELGRKHHMMWMGGGK